MKKSRKKQKVPKPRVKKTVQELKDEGNAYFQSGNYSQATASYTKGIKLGENIDFPRIELSKQYSNRAQSYIKLKQYSKALSDTETVIEYNPKWDKGYYLKAKALMWLKEYDKAEEMVEYTNQISPQNDEILNLLKQIQDKKQIHLEDSEDSGENEEEEKKENKKIFREEFENSLDNIGTMKKMLMNLLASEQTILKCYVEAKL